jgi:hypothetical protein
MKLYSLKEAAVYLGLKPETLKYHVYQSGYLKGQLVGKSLVFTEEELDEFKARVPVPGRKKSKAPDEE